MLFTPTNDVTHTVYCGPRVIAALTGVPVSRIEKMFRRVRNDYRAENYFARRKNKELIRGTRTSEVLRVLDRLGCKVTPLTLHTKTLGGFVEDTKHISVAFLINVTGHWTSTFKGKCSDNSLSFPKWRVIKAWRVDAPAVPKYTADDPIAPPARPAKPKPDIKAVRYQRTLANIKRWETKQKRAKTALRKLHAARKYYESRQHAAVANTAEVQPKDHHKSDPNNEQHKSVQLTEWAYHKPASPAVGTG